MFSKVIEARLICYAKLKKLNITSYTNIVLLLLKYVINFTTIYIALQQQK